MATISMFLHFLENTPHKPLIWAANNTGSVMTGAADKALRHSNVAKLYLDTKRASKLKEGYQYIGDFDSDLIGSSLARRAWSEEFTHYDVVQVCLSSGRGEFIRYVKAIHFMLSVINTKRCIFLNKI